MSKAGCLLVCGSRYWTDLDCILTRLREIQPRLVIHGACKGADILAGQAAQLLGIQVTEYPADWKRYGRAAGPIRNQQMLDEGKPDRVLAFHSDIKRSKGTADMIRRAKKAGLTIGVCRGEAAAQGK